MIAIVIAILDVVTLLVCCLALLRLVRLHVNRWLAIHRDLMVLTTKMKSLPPPEEKS